MATVSIDLMTHKKADSDGGYPVAIRVYHKKNLYFFFPFRISKKDWDESRSRVRASHHNHNLVNQIINEKYNTIDDTVILTLSRNRNMSATKLRSVIEDELSDKVNDFLSYYEDFVDGLLPEFSHSYYELHSSVMNHLKKFFNGSLPFDEIDVQNLRRLKTYFLNKGISANSTTRYIKTVNTVFKQAMKDGVTPQDTNPFELLDYPSEEVHKTYLTADTIEELRQIDFQKWTLRWKAQKAFMFSFWTAGMRFSDVCLLEWSNIKDWSDDIPTLDYEMLKNGKRVTMPLLPPAKAILEELKPDVVNIGLKDQRIFKLIDDGTPTKREQHRALKTANTNVNRSLRKVVSRRLSVDEHLTFHAARHSFAASFENLDLPVQFLQSLLAHSSSKTTEVYRKSFSSKQNKKAMTEFFDKFQLAASDQ